MPIAAVTASATRSVSSARNDGSPASDGASAASPGAVRPGLRSICGTQITNASTAGMAHSARGSRHPPPVMVWSGTVRPAASAAPSDMVVVYSPIISPTRLEKSCLMAAGISTLPMAMAAPRINVPANRPTRLGWSRTAMPTAISSTATPSRRCSPIARVRRGVQNAKTPYATTGIVVRRPAMLGEMRRLGFDCVQLGRHRHHADPQVQRDRQESDGEQHQPGGRPLADRAADLSFRRPLTRDTHDRLPFGAH